jgi:hypothetical protein
MFVHADETWVDRVTGEIEDTCASGRVRICSGANGSDLAVVNNDGLIQFWIGAGAVNELNVGKSDNGICDGEGGREGVFVMGLGEDGARGKEGDQDKSTQRKHAPTMRGVTGFVNQKWELRL